ncbi:MAG: six-cysteine peptide SCIFF [Clostridiaceae bacterium]|jgi:predicted ribosomally synthesized six-cysteine peptide SCIFF|nr:six-cysteine peptide SCIFF [Clostridiaceae bacterium]
MKTTPRIVTLKTRDLIDETRHDGCGECQTSCQSACKTSSGVVNQACEQ